jgi:chemotaxis protein MotB
MRTIRLILIGLILLTPGCLEQQVTQRDLHRQLALARAQSDREIETLRADVNRLRPAAAERETLRIRVESLEREAESLRRMTEEAMSGRDAMEAELRDLRQLRDEARRLSAEAEVVRRRAAEAEAERDAIRADLQKFIDLGGIGVEITPDGVMITMRDAILFDSGKSALKPGASELLAKLAEVLKRSKAREIRIAGHTDNVPIKTPEFPSNWELSSARAISVLHSLVETHRLPPNRLVALGFGEHRPLVANTNTANRTRNRRVEVYLVPEGN